MSSKKKPIGTLIAILVVIAIVVAANMAQGITAQHPWVRWLLAGIGLLVLIGFTIYLVISARKGAGQDSS